MVSDPPADYDAARNLNPALVSSLYGRGLAKIKSGDAAGGEADIARAKKLKPDVAQDFVP